MKTKRLSIVTMLSALLCTAAGFWNVPGASAQELIKAGLKNDTAPGGKLNNDGLTSDPTIAGSLLSRKQVSKLEAKFSGSELYTEITSSVKSNGTFVLNLTELERINRAQLKDGPYTLQIEAKDEKEKAIGSARVKFILDTTPPQPFLYEPWNGGAMDPRRKFIDVAILDSSEIVTTLIDTTDLSIAHKGKRFRAKRAPKTNSGLFRYHYEGNFSEDSVKVTFEGEQFFDVAGNSNKAHTESFVIHTFQPTFNGLGWRPRHLMIEPNINAVTNVDNYTPPANKTPMGEVFVHSGEASLRRVDLEIPGRGFNWRFERVYRSGWFGYMTALGHNWDFNYNRRLLVVANTRTPDAGQISVEDCRSIYAFQDCKPTDVIRFNGMGRVDIYKKIPGRSTTDTRPPEYSSPPGFYTQLTVKVDNDNNTIGYTERDRDGTVITYGRISGELRMTSMADRNGNTMRFQYNESDQLQLVIDTMGRKIEYLYKDDRLIKVRDFIGREIRFEYNADGGLVAVTGPRVIDTPQGNDFAGGKTERYDYRIVTPTEGVHSRYLVTVTAPNEVAQGGIENRREFFIYDERGRITEHTCGGTNKNGVPAGGTYKYGYRGAQDPDPAPPGRGPFDPPDESTLGPATTFVTDRNGNRTDFQFSRLGNASSILKFTNREVRKSDPDFYETDQRHDYEGRRLTITHPEGNSVEYFFDRKNADSLQHGNLLEVIRRSDADRGGEAWIWTTYSYEPIYNQGRTLADARTDASGQRYTTKYFFDYQEGNRLEALAEARGITADSVKYFLETAGVRIGLGDLNGDGRTDQIAGNVIRIEYPTVKLLPGSHQAGIEGNREQEIVDLFAYNNFGQLVRQTDPEGNVTTYDYYSEQDPDGDGARNGSLQGNAKTGGYLRLVTRDAVRDLSRNSGTNPRAASIRTRYKYDPVGNVTREIDGRGIATDYVVNALNQVVQIVRAADYVPFSSAELEAKVEAEGESFGYIERLWYDYNNNVVLRQKEDRGNTSNVDGNPPRIYPTPSKPADVVHPDPTSIVQADAQGGRAFVDMVYKYDILDNLIETIQEVENGANRRFLSTRYRYDPNGNLVLTIFPEGNANRTIYDERDLVFRQSRGAYEPGNLLESGIASDGNTKTTLKDNSKSWTHRDWRDRTVWISAGAGKGQIRTIAQNSETTLIVDPEWDIIPNKTSVYEISLTLLGPEDPTDYDVRGGLPCNCSSYKYDGNKNMIEAVDAADTDLSPDNNSPDLDPGDRTRHVYDGFDRLVSTIDAVGNQTVRQYDLVDNLTREIAFGPNGGPSPTSDGPNVLRGPVSIYGVIQRANLASANALSATEYSYDEMNRVFQTDQVLFVKTPDPTVRPPNVADGAASLGKKNLTPGDDHPIPGLEGIKIIGRVTTRQEYDRKSRLTFTVEDDGDISRTLYDGADRVIKTVDPEGNTVESAYDGNNNVIEVREIDLSQKVSGDAGMLQRGKSAGSNDSRTLRDTRQSWRPFEWAGLTLQITGGKGEGQVRRIIDNTRNQLTVGQDWAIIPNATSTYAILPLDFIAKGRSTGLNTEKSLNDATNTNWQKDQWQGFTVEITGGPGAGQVRRITSNNAFQLIVATPWEVIPDAGSHYAIYARPQPGISEVFLTTFFYDRLNRLQSESDNLGQTMHYRYDSRNNLVAKADAQGPVRGTITRRAFSGGARTVNTGNAFGNVTLYYYDGINRQTRQEMILTASGSGDGVHIGASLEGIKNAKSSIKLIAPAFAPAADTTQGGGDGIIRIGATHDDNSLISAQIDDQGNVTLYLYDNLNRRVTETKGLTIGAKQLDKKRILGNREIVMPRAATIDDPESIATDKINAQLAAAQARLDKVAPLFPSLAGKVGNTPPTTVVLGYDAESNVLIFEDENDTEVFTKYDALNRPIAVRVFRSGQSDSHKGDPIFAPTPLNDPAKPGASLSPVVGTTKQNFQHDGLSRLVMATDNNDPSKPADNSKVTYAFDSLSRLIEETQQIGNDDPQAVSTGWRAHNLRSTLTYPNGRMLKYTYDDLDRLDTIAEQGMARDLVDYNYLGPYRVLERRYPINNTRLTFLGEGGAKDLGYDGLRRQTRLRHLRSDSSLIVGFAHTYDRTNNKLTEDKLHAPDHNELYAYDSDYRLLRFERSTLSAAKNGIAAPNAIMPQQSKWEFDGAGNWTSVDGETRQHSSFNEITTRNHEGVVDTLSYDDNGNLTDDGAKTLQWDFGNLLRKVTRKFDGQVIARYAYDAGGRRIHKTVTNSGTLDGTTAYYYDGLRVIEEHEQTQPPARQYIYGNYIDEVLVMDRNLDADNSATSPADQRLFYHQNSLMSVYALTDPAATLVEGYLYDAYGQNRLFQPGQNGVVDFGGDDDISLGGESQKANPYFFTGRYLDSETGLLYYRTRYLSKELGRFISRDLIGCWGDLTNLGNGYAYVGNGPVTWLDPFGLEGYYSWNDYTNMEGQTCQQTRYCTITRTEQNEPTTTDCKFVSETCSSSPWYDTPAQGSSFPYPAPDPQRKLAREVADLKGRLDKLENQNAQAKENECASAKKARNETAAEAANLIVQYTANNKIQTNSLIAAAAAFVGPEGGFVPPGPWKIGVAAGLGGIASLRTFYAEVDALKNKAKQQDELVKSKCGK